MMIFSSKNEICSDDQSMVPLWQLDTDRYTVIFTAEGKKPKETHFSSEWVRYHINYTAEFYPDRLERLVESGEILAYLEDLDNRVFEAIDEQTDEWKRTERDYLLAVENGDILAQSKIANTLDERARELIYPKMVLV